MVVFSEVVAVLGDQHVALLLDIVQRTSFSGDTFLGWIVFQLFLQSPSILNSATNKHKV